MLLGFRKTIPSLALGLRVVVFQSVNLVCGCQKIFGISSKSVMPPKRARSSDSKASRGPSTKKRKTKATVEDDEEADIAAVDQTKGKKKSGTAQTQSYPKEIDPATNKEQDPDKMKFPGKMPKRNKKGELVFDGVPDFRPNMTPQEVLQAGSFGGTYFRPIKSGVTGKNYSGVWKELPKDWLEGLNIGKQVSCSVYDDKVNTYKAKCGGSLEMWESSGWIHKQDPYGWFHWYCRFYQGRRSPDDARQIGRWLRCAGLTGRWRCNLISKCVRSGCAYDNVAISPVVRQTLQHWAYKLTQDDFDTYAKKMKRKGQC